MKKLIKTALLLFALALPATAMAYDFEVDGIAYMTDLFGDYAIVDDWEDGNTYSGNVTIPETVNHDGTTYPVTKINAYAFSNCAELTGVTIPEVINEIGDHSFENCSMLTKVNIPDAVTEIGSATFENCTSLTSIEFPAGITKIGLWSFQNCTALTDVYCHVADPDQIDLGMQAFALESENYSGRTLHVPASSVAAYKSSDWAEYFGKIVGM